MCDCVSGQRERGSRLQPPCEKGRASVERERERERERMLEPPRKSGRVSVPQPPSERGRA